MKNYLEKSSVKFVVTFGIVLGCVTSVFADNGVVEAGNLNNTAQNSTAVENKGITSDEVVTTSGTQTLTNKTFADNTTQIVASDDNTKVVKLQCSDITSGTTRTLTVPDKDGTIATTTDSFMKMQQVANYEQMVSSDKNSPNTTIWSKTYTNTFENVNLHGMFSCWSKGGVGIFNFYLYVDGMIVQNIKVSLTNNNMTNWHNFIPFDVVCALTPGTHTISLVKGSDTTTTFDAGDRMNMAATECR